MRPWRRRSPQRNNFPSVKRPIIVFRIIDRLNVGGPAIHASVTTRGLDKERFGTLLIHGAVEPGEADMGDLIDDKVIDRVILPKLGRELRPLSDLKTLAQLVALMLRLKPDVVHTHKAKAGALGRMAALIARVPVRIHTFHGHVFSGYFGAQKTQAFLAIERMLARTTTKLVALSDGLVDELADVYRIAPRDKFAVVPLGLPLGPFVAARRRSGAIRQKLAIGDETRLIGIIGRMVPVKDHATFIAAAIDLAARHNDVAFVFIGGGEREAEARQAAAPLGPRAHFLGWQRDLAPLYADLDVVALSSVNEGTPVTLIEAMAAAIPVASTAVGGVDDLLEKGARGELAPARDPVALSAAIERALTPAAKARAISQADAVAEQYGEARLCRDLETLYTTLLRDAHVSLTREKRGGGRERPPVAHDL